MLFKIFNLLLSSFLLAAGLQSKVLDVVVGYILGSTHSHYQLFKLLNLTSHTYQSSVFHSC